MKQMCLLLTVTMAMILPFRSQAQDSQIKNSITAPEFRQALIDLATYLDARKGTNFVSQFESIPDDVLEKMLTAVANPRAFQSAASQLKDSLNPSQSAAPSTQLGIRSRLALSANAAQFPSCPQDTIIDDSSGAACTPSYPLPTSPDWQNLVNSLFPINALSGPINGDYSNVVNQTCNTDIEANLDITVSALYGTVGAAAVACGILDNVPIGYQVCYGVVAGIAVAGAVSQGLLSDCFEQDNNVLFAQSDAAFHNTVTIYDTLGVVATTANQGLTNASTTENNTTTLLNDYATINNNLTNVSNNLTKQVKQVDTDVQNVGTNVVNTGTNLANQVTKVDSDLKQTGTTLTAQVTGLDQTLTARANKIDTEVSTDQALQLRLQIEANLGSSSSAPVGLFEVPQSAGGYLELVRSIVADILNKMAAQGLPGIGITLLAVDEQIANGNYKQAYQILRQDYQQAIQPH